MLKINTKRIWKSFFFYILSQRFCLFPVFHSSLLHNFVNKLLFLSTRKMDESEYCHARKVLIYFKIIIIMKTRWIRFAHKISFRAFLVTSNFIIIKLNWIIQNWIKIEVFMTLFMFSLRFEINFLLFVIK